MQAACSKTGHASRSKKRCSRGHHQKSCNVPRFQLRGAPPDPTGVMKMETSLTPSFPPHVYRNAYVAGYTPFVDQSRLSEEEVFTSLYNVLYSAGRCW